jgi:hypothetical protein
MKTDSEQIRDLALLYGRAVDRLDAALLSSVFTDDGVLEGGGTFRIEGGAKIGPLVMQTLKAQFLRTYHAVHNHLLTVTGDRAEGEVYGIAHHILRKEDGLLHDHVMTMRYKDRYVKSAGAWKITHRYYIVEWTQTAPIDGFGPAGNDPLRPAG